MRSIQTFSRLAVGGLFIFSGLIKINDPIGTAIKMEEYLEVFSTDFGAFFQVFVPWSMEIGFILIVAEVVLGVAVLLAYQMRMLCWALLGLIVFFSALTFYSAYFNKVTDCGCFGEAIKLTPWTSFYKDLILLVLILFLFWRRREFTPLLPPNQGHLAVGGALLTSVGLGIYALRHLPPIDFTAYKKGASIPLQMQPAEAPKIEYTFRKGDEEVTSSKFLSTQDGYAYVSSRVLNEDKAKPKISDYSVLDREGADLTETTFQGVQLLVVVENVEDSSGDALEAVHSLVEALDSEARCFILTSSSPEKAEAFRHRYQLAIPCYYADATVLKTMVRSNPGLMLWKNGVVLGKWHYNDIPTAQAARALIRR